MILYHGSDTEIEVIDLTRCNPNKDFGQGFYLTEHLPDAENIARQRSVRSQKLPVINRYEFDERMLESDSLRVKHFGEYSLEWAEFVFKNRRGDIADRYDIVYGPIADDRIGAQITRYNEGYIDANEFLARIKYIKGITFQYYFGTEAAIAHLKKIQL